MIMITICISEAELLNILMIIKIVCVCMHIFVHWPVCLHVHFVEVLFSVCVCVCVPRCVLPLPVSMQNVYTKGTDHRGEKFSRQRKWCRQTASEEWDWCMIVCQLFSAGVMSPCRLSCICYAKTAKGPKLSPCVSVSRWCDRQSENERRVEVRPEMMLRFLMYSNQLLSERRCGGSLVWKSRCFPNIRCGLNLESTHYFSKLIHTQQLLAAPM